MNRFTVPAVGVSALLLLSACSGSSSKSPKVSADAPRVAVALTDAGCDVGTTTIPAGGVVFAITNKSSSKVTEAEIMSGEKILAEKENVAAGLSGSVSLNLKEGTYAVRCPGGTGPKDVAFTVTAAAGGTTTASDSAEQKAAAAGWADYVRGQVDEQVAATKVLTDAVRKGDLAAAAAAYPAARVNYERIEPVAESFGDIDPAIDIRIADVKKPSDFTGYHRLEKAIFVDRSLAGMVPIAAGLDAQVTKLQTLVKTVTFDAPDLANGAGELLNEVGTSKITGEEEAYSHIDLVDFQANVDGAHKAFDLLTPALKTLDAALVATITTRFADVDNGLKAYRTGDGATDFKPYTAVPQDQHKVLASLVDSLAEPLSKVGALLVKK